MFCNYLVTARYTLQQLVNEVRYHIGPCWENDAHLVTLNSPLRFLWSMGFNHLECMLLGAPIVDNDQ